MGFALDERNQLLAPDDFAANAACKRSADRGEQIRVLFRGTGRERPRVVRDELLDVGAIAIGQGSCAVTPGLGKCRRDVHEADDADESSQ